MARRGVTFSGARPQLKLAQPSEPVGPHICEACGTAARWGYGVRLLKGQPGRWYCYSHRPQEANHEG